jgi:hypothetical protein
MAQTSYYKDNGVKQDGNWKSFEEWMHWGVAARLELCVTWGRWKNIKTIT